MCWERSISICSCQGLRNDLVQKLGHSFVAIFSGPMCWELSISICSLQGQKFHHFFVAILSGAMCWKPSISICSFQGFGNHLENCSWRWSVPWKWPRRSGPISWRNLITPSWPFKAAQCAGNAPSPSAVVKVSGTTWCRNWATPSWPFSAAQCAGNFPFLSAVFKVRNWITSSWPFWAAQCAGNHPSPFAAFKVSGTTLKTAAGDGAFPGNGHEGVVQFLGEIWSRLRGHLKRPNVLGTFHLHLQLSRFRDAENGHEGVIQFLH